MCLYNIGEKKKGGRILGDYNLKKENDFLKKENLRLRGLCEEKDFFFMELMSDALRCGSKLAAKHMSDRKKHINGK